MRCPGCYAYDAAHLGGGGNTLHQLVDYKEDALVKGVLQIVDEYHPLHLSLVGGDPLVRYRELEVLLPKLDHRGIHVQIVTSAFRQIPKHWATLPKFNLVVSVDGLQPEHDARRKPATYERILKNLEGARATIHCTITGQIADRPHYLEDFLHFWSVGPEAKKVWMSIFTPQLGAEGPEILTPEVRAAVIAELLRLRPLYPILDMHESWIRELNILPARQKNASLPAQLGPCPPI